METIIKERIDSSEYRYALSGTYKDGYTITSITAEDKGDGYILTLKNNVQGTGF